MAMTEAEKRVVDGTAWEEFCDSLKAAGKIIQSEKAPKDPFNQAEGYRYLSRLLRGGLRLRGDDAARAGEDGRARGLGARGGGGARAAWRPWGGGRAPW